MRAALAVLMLLFAGIFTSSGTCGAAVQPGETPELRWGGNVWETEESLVVLPPEHSGPHSDEFEIENKPAEQVVREHYRRR
jgi:hypothetical protein